VKHYDLAAGAQQDIQLDAVGAVGARARERGGGVFGFERAGAPMAED
jgi:hypothetical protein